MSKYYIAVGTRRSVYHKENDCMALKNADDYTDKPWDVIKRMVLEPCPNCVVDD